MVEAQGRCASPRRIEGGSHFLVMPAAPHCECNERIALAEATRHLTSPTLASPRPPSACPKRATPPACPGSAAQVELALRACVSQEPLQEQEPLSLVLLLLYLLLSAFFFVLATIFFPCLLPYLPLLLRYSREPDKSPQPRSGLAPPVFEL